ncbi:MAG: ABC transporter substrate-binding protein [Cenarchaeum sp. SB0663_bin_5]|nr:ABC transporter substrate-binding protein [Cenarchaeum sp. SB0663_bin_5]MYH04055.1 ABC transporter substrate-binding protein [Cenarchaeum sp. SB0675_bin_21]MYL12096.1 ABC transporter substrate-binding protein [Cenarchaeum sp. SB0669_bin_11]
MHVQSYLILVGMVSVLAMPLSFADIQGDVLVGVLNAEDDLSDRAVQISLAIREGVSDFNEFLEDMNADWRIIPDVSFDITQDVDMILGPIHDGTLNIVEYAQANNILVVGCCNAVTEMAIPGDTVFQIYPDAIKQGSTLAHILHAQGVDVVVPMYSDTANGYALWRAMTDTFTARGGIVDEGVRYIPSDGFSSEVERLAKRVQDNLNTHDSDVNIAVLLMAHDENLHVFESALLHDVLYMVPWFADEYMTENPALIQNSTISSFLESVNYTSIQMAKTLNAQHDGLKETILDTNNMSPGAFAYTAYDAVWILGMSILMADTTDIASVSAVLPDVAYNYTGIMGNITLDISGDMRSGDYTLWSIRDSTWERTSRYIHETQQIIPVLPSTVIIPVIADITGDLSVLGREGLAGMALATDDFNADQQEMSADWRLELNIMDSETDPEKHLELIQDVDGGIILSCASSNSLAKSLDYINERGLVVVSSCSTSAELSIPDSLYRLSPDDGNIIDLLTTQLEDRYTIIIVRNDSWGIAQSLQISERLNNYTIVSYLPDAQNYTNIIHDTLDAITVHGTQNTAILLLGFAESADILSAAADHDVLYDVPWFGSNGNARHPKIVDDARSSNFAELVSFTAPMNADATIPAKLQLNLSYSGTMPVTDLAQTTLRLDHYVSDRVPVAYASGPVAYDSVWLTVMALNNIQSLEPEAFQSAFVDVAASYDGIIGPTTLNEAGDISLALYDIWTVQNGDWTFQSRYNDGVLLSVDDMRLQSLATLVVENAIADFNANHTVSLQNDEVSLFILDTSTDEIISHSAHPSLVGTSYYDLINLQGVNIGELIIREATTSGSWELHAWPNPDTGVDETITAWIKSHGNHIFGSGIYVP